MPATPLNEAYRSNQNVDRFLIVEVIKKCWLWSYTLQTYLMIPKEIDLKAARKWFTEHPVSSQYRDYVGFLRWLGAYDASQKRDYAIIEINERKEVKQ
jgi:hypothetical protein